MGTQQFSWKLVHVATVPRYAKRGTDTTSNEYGGLEMDQNIIDLLWAIANTAQENPDRCMVDVCNDNFAVHHIPLRADWQDIDPQPRFGNGKTIKIVQVTETGKPKGEWDEAEKKLRPCTCDNPTVKIYSEGIETAKRYAECLFCHKTSESSFYPADVLRDWNLRGHKCLDCDERCDELEDEICADCTAASRQAANTLRVTTQNEES